MCFPFGTLGETPVAFRIYWRKQIMATVELTDTQLMRDAITLRIAEIDDPAALNAFLTLTDNYCKPKPLTAEQLEDIEIGRRQIAAGEWISHEDFMKELDEEFPDNER